MCKNSNSISIRVMRSRDIDFGMHLKTVAGWNQTEDDWQLYLRLSPDGCFVGEIDGNAAGTVTTINYGNSVGWIGMMLVDPQYRRRGLAKNLMRHAMEHLSSCATIKLDATPAGKKVYDSIGFRDEYGMYRMALHHAPSDSAFDSSISPITDEDLTDITAVDSEVFGANRGMILEQLARNNPKTAWKHVDKGSIDGYCTGRRGTRYFQIGPIIAYNTPDAVEMTKAAVSETDEGAVVIDVPSDQNEFMKWLESVGFSIERPLIRMYFGKNESPGQPEHVYGICGPELG